MKAKQPKEIDLYRSVYKITGEDYKVNFQGEGKTSATAVANAQKVAKEIVGILNEFIEKGEFSEDEKG